VRGSEARKIAFKMSITITRYWYQRRFENGCCY